MVLFLVFRFTGVNRIYIMHRERRCSVTELNRLSASEGEYGDGAKVASGPVRRLRASGPETSVCVNLLPPVDHRRVFCVQQPLSSWEVARTGRSFGATPSSFVLKKRARA